MHFTPGHTSGTERTSASALPRRLYLLLLCAGLVLTASCGGGGSSGDAGTGSITFSIGLPGQESSQATSKAASFSCWDYGIVTVLAYVYDENDNLIATGGPWPCDDGTGTITGVRVGLNRRIVITCFNVSGNVNYLGETGEVEVSSEEVSDAGIIGIGPVVTNQAPVLNVISFAPTPAGGTFSLTLDGNSATDLDGDTLTFEVADLPYGASFDRNTGNFIWVPEVSDVGEHRVLFKVTDSGIPRLSDWQVVTLRVTSMATGDTPSFPVLSLVPDGPQHALPGDIVSIILEGSDPNGDGLTLSIETVPGKVNVPSLASIETINGDPVFQWDTAGAAAGNYYVRLLLMDDSATAFNEDFEDVTITVGVVNRPPVIAPIGERVTVTGQTLRFPVTGSDPDRDSLTFSLDPEGAISDSIYPTGAVISGQEFVWTPGVSGTYDVRFRVTDNGVPAESDFEDVTIYVYDPVL